jgi:RNA polymerase sigma-70 factor, ECF subfamily
MDRTETHTIDLIAQVRSGDRSALSRLVERELPPLKKFARGRLPVWARSATDTHDLVHAVVLRALPRLETWNSEGRGALRAFLRKAVGNQIVDEIRRASRRKASPVSLDTRPDSAPSPLTRIIQEERLSTLRSALARLSESDRRLITARFGWDLRYAELAAVLGRPNANAARVAVERAVERLAKLMSAGAGPSDLQSQR